MYDIFKNPVFLNSHPWTRDSWVRWLKWHETPTSLRGNSGTGWSPSSVSWPASRRHGTISYCPPGTDSPKPSIQSTHMHTATISTHSFSVRSTMSGPHHSGLMQPYAPALLWQQCGGRHISLPASLSTVGTARVSTADLSHESLRAYYRCSD